MTSQVARRYGSSMETTGRAAWERLRASRWEPPPPTSRTAERRLTYQTALQQSEELFTAAGHVGFVVRPVLVFYALSQAGRAIAAAADSASGDQWRLLGHGIKARGLEGPLTEVRVLADRSGQGSFTRLSTLLGSPLWSSEDAIVFTMLWDTIPENAPCRRALHNDAHRRRTPLLIERALRNQPHAFASAHVRGLPLWLRGQDDVGAAFEEYIKAFPGARDYASFDRQIGDKGPRIRTDAEGWDSVQLSWVRGAGTFEALENGDDKEYAKQARSLAHRYGDDLYFFPEVSAAGSLHPLMSWWSVLFALSMVARYEPASWTRHTDVNTSRCAQPIEELLDLAMDVVPRLIADTIDEVSASNSDASPRTVRVPFGPPRVQTAPEDWRLYAPE